MILYHSPTSPYVRKVMVLLHETGQLDDVALENLATTPFDPAEGLLPSNPWGKCPHWSGQRGRRFMIVG